jgi:hypothetical protein
MRAIVVVCLLMSAGVPAGAADAPPNVSFELLTRQGAPITAAQQWYQTLTELGIDGLQIRSAHPGDEISIRQAGSDDALRYQVVGILSPDNVLYVPGGKFKASEVAKLRAWLASLKEGGVEGVTEPRSAFGLTARQLADVNDDLKQPLGISTKGQRADRAAEPLADRLKYPLELDASARRLLAEVTLADELTSVSRGTALAAMLRPAGLAFEPRHSDGALRYRVRKALAGREAWPVGWKPTQRPAKILPELFEFLNVEIKDISVAEALSAIEGRLKVPLLFDYNALAAAEIDPAAVTAEVPEKRMTYSQVLQKVLAAARLKYEVRTDEADRPLIWITTIKPQRG